MKGSRWGTYWLVVVDSADMAVVAMAGVKKTWRKKEKIHGPSMISPFEVVRKLRDFSAGFEQEVGIAYEQACCSCSFHLRGCFEFSDR